MVSSASPLFDSELRDSDTVLAGEVRPHRARANAAPVDRPGYLTDLRTRNLDGLSSLDARTAYMYARSILYQSRPYTE